MLEVIPAIIGQNFAEVEEKIARVDELVNWAQLDIMDGIFVPEYTWPFDGTQGRQSSSDLETLNGRIKLEAHLMVKDPEEIVEDWLNVCDRVIFHLEATADTASVLKAINNSACQAGVALLLETPLEQVEPYLDQVAVVQLMSIATIGHHGEPLDERVYQRISALRAKSPTVTINVDGGVNLANAEKLIAAGADGLVVGSALWQASDLPGAINALRRQS